MMSAKLANTGLSNKGYDIIISVDDVTNKILSRSTSIVDVFM